MPVGCETSDHGGTRLSRTKTSRTFSLALERAGELKRVTVPVDPTLEISEIVTRTVRAKGPALLFEKPTRGDMPVAINLFGTDKRMAMALGVDDVEEIGARIGELIKPDLTPGWAGIRDGLSKLMQLKSVPPKKVKGAPCQEVVYRGADVDLDRLPGLWMWPGDGGIFHNYGLTHTKHPETGKRNLGLYRLQQHSKNTLGMHWQIHKDSTAHHAVAERLGQRLPVAIAIGCDPVVSYAATAPLPGDIDEYLFAGFLRGERVEMVDCLTVPLQVPAHAQIVLEGYVEPGERHSGRAVRRPHRLLHAGRAVPGAAHRGDDDAARPDLPLDHHVEAAAGRRPDRARHRAHLPAADQDAGAGHRDMAMPEPGVFHNCLIVSIDKRYPKHAQKVMSAVWGAHLLSLTKLVVVVDADCDPHDYAEVAFRAFGNVDYAHDLVVTSGPVDHLDHASYQQFWGGKAGIDATRKTPAEGYHRGWPEEMVMSPSVVDTVNTTMGGVRAVTITDQPKLRTRSRRSSDSSRSSTASSRCRSPTWPR